MMRRLIAALCLAAAPLGAQSLTLPFEATGNAAYETGLDLAAAALANALLLSRDAAWQAGTEPMPPKIREALLTRFPADLLDSVEYRVGVTEDATVQSWSMRYGEATAVTTIDTITFAYAWDAEHNIALWAHEVTHAEQFRAWGLSGFAQAYVRDHEAVEAEAYAVGAEFKARYGGG